ncbi:hypothetical protein RT41_GL000358 [Lactococcus fujiensis JCM 16395]|uniref:Uncharacterized protein n=1 Tax=Lactococcus fujiensis JCM 16395 TaxID=1291764 RepID=A0A2A5RQ88_9LACT|nr:hypothetical protein RT41_GL000358 [Lactococcus fujiensis JCM 16395]
MAAETFKVPKEKIKQLKKNMKMNFFFIFHPSLLPIFPPYHSINYFYLLEKYNFL